MRKPEYTREVKIFNKSKDDEKKDLIMSILRTKMELNINIKNYEYAEKEQVDYYLYQMKANQAKLDYLIKKAKENKIELTNLEKLKYNA